MSDSPAVFLDRDGVLVEDVNLLTRPEEFVVLAQVSESLARLKSAGYRLVVASNQPVVARGMITEEQVRQLHRHLQDLLGQAGAPLLDAWYFCPHHPQASLAEYRADCPCRKPKPGMLQQAAAEHGLDLARSFMIGDRITDVIAGARAGCRTVLVQTGKHLEPPIQSSEPLDLSIRPEHVCVDLPAAVAWILSLK